MDILTTLTSGIASLIATALPLILLSNWFIAGVKQYMEKAQSKTWIRGLLFLFAGAAVLITAPISGHDIDYNKVSDLFVTGLTILVTAGGAHLSYKIIKK